MIHNDGSNQWWITISFRLSDGDKLLSFWPSLTNKSIDKQTVFASQMEMMMQMKNVTVKTPKNDRVRRFHSVNWFEYDE